MAGREKFGIKKVADALRQSGGVVTDAAKLLSSKKTTCSRNTVTNMLARHPELRAVREESREESKDLAEGGLLTALKAAEPWAIKYFLDHQARDRGYGKRFHEITGKDGGPIETKSTGADFQDLEGKSADELARLYAEACEDPATVH